MRVMKLLRRYRRNNADYKGDPYSYVPVPPMFLPLLLVEKMHEEVEEIRAGMNDPTEYADLLQALYDLAELNGISQGKIEATRLAKLLDAGDFISEPAMLYRGDLSAYYDGLGLPKDKP